MNSKALFLMAVYCVCLLSNLSLKSQSKYFEKDIGWSDVHEGLKIRLVSDTSFLVCGTFISLTEFIKKTYSMQLDLVGDVTNLSIYEHDLGGDMTFRDVAITSSGFAFVGWMSGIPAFDAYLLFSDFNGEQDTLLNIGNETYSTSARTMLLTDDDGFLIGGYTILNTITNDWELWLTKVDSAGIKIWEHTYEEYPKDNYISELLPRPGGGCYAIGTINSSFTTGHVAILEIDEMGEIIEDYIYTFGGSDGAGAAILTNDGGFFIDGFTNTDNWMQLKLDSNFNIEWQYDEYASGCSSTVQFPDSTYVIAGCYDYSPDLKLQLNLTKISADGSTTLWTRFYGGAGNDYGYDMTTTPDGGFIVSGRTETPGHADVYIVKTNCMGLLTEPQAAFETEVAGLSAAFTNLSQYVYPDSIDGGHYIWDFGDGTSSMEFSPIHEYGSDAYYTVTLTAVVCSDTSVYEQEIAVGSVGVGNALQMHSIVLPFYPNPAAKSAVMDYDLKNGRAIVQVFDLTGRLLKSIDLQGKGVYELDLADWASGVYFYQVEMEGQAVLREKLVVW